MQYRFKDGLGRLAVQLRDLLQPSPPAPASRTHAVHRLAMAGGCSASRPRATLYARRAGLAPDYRLQPTESCPASRERPGRCADRRSCQVPGQHKDALTIARAARAAGHHTDASNIAHAAGHDRESGFGVGRHGQLPRSGRRENGLFPANFPTPSMMSCVGWRTGPLSEGRRAPVSRRDILALKSRSGRRCVAVRPARVLGWGRRHTPLPDRRNITSKADLDGTACRSLALGADALLTGPTRLSSKAGTAVLRAASWFRQPAPADCTMAS